MERGNSWDGAAVRELGSPLHNRSKGEVCHLVLGTPLIATCTKNICRFLV